MQSRRWWSLAVAAVLSAGISSTFAADRTPILIAQGKDPASIAANQKLAGDLVTQFLKGGTETQKAADALNNIAKDNLETVGALNTFMNEEVGPRFEQRIFIPDVSPNIQTVAIVALVNSQTTMSPRGIAPFDGVYREQLANPNAAVRYWSAKGLVNIVAAINGGGPVAKGKIVAKITVSATTETSILAQTQMVKALAAFGEFTTVNNVLEKNCGRFRYEAFSFTDSEALVAELGAVAEAFKLPPKGKDLTDAVKNAAWLASFAAQQAANEKVNNLASANKTFEDAKDIVNAAIGVLNAASKPGTFPLSSARDALELFDFVEKLTKKDIQAQADFKAVPPPPEVKLGGAPKTTPASSTSAPAAPATTTAAPATSTAPVPAATSTRPK